MKEIDIDICPSVLEGGLFTVRAANGTQYPIVTVYQNGIIRHRLPADSPFQKDMGGKIAITYNVKG